MNLKDKIRIIQDFRNLGSVLKILLPYCRIEMLTNIPLILGERLQGMESGTDSWT